MSVRNLGDVIGRLMLIQEARDKWPKQDVALMFSEVGELVRDLDDIIKVLSEVEDRIDQLETDLQAAHERIEDLTQLLEEVSA